MQMASRFRSADGPPRPLLAVFAAKQQPSLHLIRPPGTANRRFPQRA